jgi:hypothetical protein
MLAPMIVQPPAIVPKGPTDLSVPRVSVRARGDAGFIFFNNYVRDYTMPARAAAQFTVRLPDGTLVVPRNPVDLPSGSSFIWPFNLTINGVKIRYTTAQLFTRIVRPDATTLYFEAIPGIDPEFAFDEKTIRSIEHASGTKTSDGGVLYFSCIRPDKDSTIDLVSAEGHKLRIVLLSAGEAENAWKVRVGGDDRLLVTNREFFADPEHVWLRSTRSPEFSFSITPPLTSLPSASLTLHPTTTTDSWQSFAASAEPRELKLDFQIVQAAGEAPPAKTGPRMPWRKHGVAEAPSDTPLPGAGRWSIRIPGDAMNGLADVFLDVNYDGDVARLNKDGKLLDDDFFNGHSWQIGLKRFLAPRRENIFELSILPLRKDAPIFLQAPKPIQFDKKDQACTLNSVNLVPEYELVIDAGNK